MESAGQTIRRARKAAGLTQSALAELAGTRQGAVSAYENGRRDPTVSTLRRLLNATGYELELGVVQIRDQRKALPATRLGRELDAHRAEILRIVAAHGGSSVGVFGSVARGEDREDSDLDLLVDLPARTSVLTIGAIAREVEELLGVEVDVVPEAALRADARDRILGEVIRL